jgi:hypothetical protein
MFGLSDGVLMTNTKDTSAAHTLIIKNKGENLTLIMDKEYEFLNDKTYSIQVQGNYPIIRLHRLVCPATKEQPFIDHINGNPLDFRKENLRPVTACQNQQNRSKHTNKATSIYKGVHKAKNWWFARLGGRKLCANLGLWKTEIEAARAYDIAALYFYAQYAKTNFAASAYSNLDLLEELKIIISKPTQRAKYTSYIGVSRDIKHPSKPWRARIKDIRQNFSTDSEAALWRDSYLRQEKLYLEPKFRLNFPTNDEVVEILTTWKKCAKRRSK